ncbi:orexin receptor type 2-like isoform X1 [Haliotis asinina]|uniref:orexin receptor type 2-like isoform X1 n=1 Tax=Haliotis asinina TaxID=109174 RepID=UPI003532098A
MHGKQHNNEVIEMIFPNSTQDSYNASTNTTVEDYSEVEPWQNQPLLWIILLLSTCVFVMGIVGNLLVWFAVWRNHRMRSATNLFLVNLALADFLVILICLPPSVISDVTTNWPLGHAMCKAVHYLQKVSVFVSVLTLTAISMERWMAICRPLWFRQTSVRAKRIIVLLWGISFAAAIPDLVVLQTVYYKRYDLTICRPSWDLKIEKISLLTILVLFYFIPLLIMTFAYAKVAICLWRSGSANESTVAAASVPRAQLLIRQKKAKMLIVVVLIFAICFLPIYILFLLRCSDVQVAKPALMIAHFLCYFNSAINPVIYNFMSCNFRREFKVACRVCCREGQGHGHTNYSAHDGWALKTTSDARNGHSGAIASRNMNLRQSSVLTSSVRISSIRKPNNQTHVHFGKVQNV